MTNLRLEVGISGARNTTRHYTAILILSARIEIIRRQIHIHVRVLLYHTWELN